MRFAVLLSLLLLTLSANAQAFTHVVQPGETLAALAERFYGKIQNENLLVVANGLDAQGGIAIVPGMRLEVPAITYVVVTEKRTWKELAQQYLGGEHRAFVLAEANNSKAWLPPDTGAEVIVPYNLRFVATGNETIVGLAYRFLGDRKLAWSLDQYNARGGRRLERGEVVMLPIVNVALTKDGKVAARQSMDLAQQQMLGAAREAQDLIEKGLPELVADVQRARYVDAVQRGTRFLESGALSRAQLARIQRLLLEAYAALGAKELAAESCAAWFLVDSKAQLDRMMMSPKLIAACESAGVKGAQEPGKTPNDKDAKGAAAKGSDVKGGDVKGGDGKSAEPRPAVPVEGKSP